MNNDEVLRVQTYLRLKFSNDMLTLKRGAKDDMVEVFWKMNLSAHCSATMKTARFHAFNMAILEFDCQPSDWCRLTCAAAARNDVIMSRMPPSMVSQSDK